MWSFPIFIVVIGWEMIESSCVTFVFWDEIEIKEEKSEKD